MKRDKPEFEHYSATYQLCLSEYVPSPLIRKILMKTTPLAVTNTLMNMKVPTKYSS